MEIAQGSIVVDLPVEEAHREWLRFTGHGETQGPSDEGESNSEIFEETESGRATFAEETPGATRVTMELRFNPQAVRDAGRAEDWVSRRIDIYLSRFRDHSSR
jgi:hypothetical protein